MVVVLSPDMMTLLRRAVECHEPDLLSLASTVGTDPLSEADREALRSTVLSEFLSAGLDSNDEPTAYGHELEELIDTLGRC